MFVHEGEEFSILLCNPSSLLKQFVLFFFLIVEGEAIHEGHHAKPDAALLEGIMNSFPREHGALAKPAVAGRPRTPKEAIFPDARSLARKEDERFKRDVAGDLH